MLVIKMLIVLLDPLFYLSRFFKTKKQSIKTKIISICGLCPSVSLYHQHPSINV